MDKINVNQLLESFKNTLRELNYSSEGSASLFSLCLILRIPNSNNHSPLFNDLIESAVQKVHPDGYVSKLSPLPYCNAMVSLALANSLLRWHHFFNGKHLAIINKLLQFSSYHINSVESIIRTVERQFEKCFQFTGMAGRWILPASEASFLLSHSQNLISDDMKSFFSPFATSFKQIFPDDFNFQTLFCDNPLVYQLAESMPSRILSLPFVKAHIRNKSGIPGNNAAFAANYYMATGNKNVLHKISSLVNRPFDGLRPSGELQEKQFILYYLHRAGVQINSFFSEELACISENHHVNGSPIELGERNFPDCDSSAISQYLHNVSDINSKMPTHYLENFWNDKNQTYSSADGKYNYSVSILIHVCEAYLTAPDVPFNQKEFIWNRCIHLLENNPWAEQHHLSPLFIWEKIISLVCTYSNLFKNKITRIHYSAFESLKRSQHVNGGFGCFESIGTTLEETAFALMAIHSMMKLPEFYESDEFITMKQNAIYYIKTNYSEDNFPEFWVSKLLCAPLLLIRAIVLSALIMSNRP